MNVAIHAHHGILTVHIDTKGIFIKTDDKGAGIPDIELAMQEGYSTASDEVREMGFGAGMGLYQYQTMLRRTFHRIESRRRDYSQRESLFS